MKIICNQKLLANKIGISQKAINGKTTLELLKGILLSAKRDNQSNWIWFRNRNRNLCTSWSNRRRSNSNKLLFWGYYKKTTDAFVEIETDNENNVYINCLNSRFKIKGDSATEYPKLPDVNKNELYDIPQDLLKNKLSKLFLHISRPNKAYINGWIIRNSRWKHKFSCNRWI